MFASVFEALGVDPAPRADLQKAVADLMPIDGVPVLEAAAMASMLSGVLVGLLIADSALPCDEPGLPLTRG